MTHIDAIKFYLSKLGIDNPNLSDIKIDGPGRIHKIFIENLGLINVYTLFGSTGNKVSSIFGSGDNHFVIDFRDKFYDEFYSAYNKPYKNDYLNSLINKNEIGLYKRFIEDKLVFKNFYI
jgi:hypothetical protein